MRPTTTLLSGLGAPVAWFLACIFFRLSLDFSYVSFVSVDRWGDGFPYSFNRLRLVESWVVLVGLIAITPYRFKKPSDFLTLVLFLLCMIPITSYYCWAGGARVWFWALAFQYVLFFCALKALGLWRIKVWRLRNGPRYAYFLIILVFILCAFRIINAGVFDQVAFGLQPEEIYTRRSFVSSKVEVGIWGYLVSWLVKVCAIYLLIDGIAARNWTKAFFAGAACLMLFGLFAHKAILFGAIAAGLLLVLWPVIKNRFSLVAAGLGFLMLVMFVSVSVLDTYLYQSIFTRRLFFVPARLDFLYYDFFSSQPSLLFSNSFLRHFFEYPFHKPYPYLIGDYSGIGGENTAANNGFLATGYMQLGWLGVFLYPIAVACLAYLVNLLGNKPPGFIVSVSFYPFAALFTSSDLPTAVLTHGIAFLLLLLWLDSDSPVRVEDAGRSASN